MGIYVLGAALWRTLIAGVPEAVTMGGIGALALAVNVCAMLLLLRFRDGDANVRSVWLCSRNDAVGNVRRASRRLELSRRTRPAWGFAIA
jgi:Co/Zn/Cd efflux system component